jgi:zinc finger protein
MDKLENQPCPVCSAKTLTLTEEETDIPYFGKAFLFSMNCSSCGYSVSDVEAEAPKEPTRYTFEINSEKDMNVRIVKSSQATVKLPNLRMSMTPGPSSIGFISNVEGLLNKFEAVLEKEKEDAEDEDVKKKAKNLLKKIRKVKWGDIATKLVIDDPSGNSAIVSDKAKVEKLKK